MEKILDNFIHVGVRALLIAPVLMLALVLSACDEVTSTTVDGPSRVEDGRTSCTHAGYCLECGMTFGGKFNCSPAFRPFCSGSQPARLRVTPMLSHYKSGEIERFESKEVLERLGTCS